MQSRLLRNLSILAGTAMIATLSPAPSAQAAITIDYQATTTGANPGAVGPFSNSASFVDSRQVGGIQLQIASSGTQNASLGTLSTTTITIQNTGTGTDTINVRLAAQGYTLPNPSVLLTSAASGSSANFTSGQTAVLQSYAALGNVGLGSIFGGTTTGAQNGVVTGDGITSTPYTFTPASASTGFASVGTYSIGQMLTITLAAGKSATFTLTSNVQVATVVPEPATVAMALTALPLFGLGALIRRRRARA